MSSAFLEPFKPSAVQRSDLRALACAAAVLCGLASMLSAAPAPPGNASSPRAGGPVARTTQPRDAVASDSASRASAKASDSARVTTLRNLNGTGNAFDFRVEGAASGAAGAAGDAGADTTANAAAQGQNAKPDDTEAGQRTVGYVGNFMLDIQNGHWNMDSKGWAALIFIGVGVVVAGAFIGYGFATLYDMAVNKEHYPVFREIGLRYSYSGENWEDGGPRLYRNAQLLGARYAMGLDRNGLGLGFAVEGGYIDLALRGLDNPAEAFNFEGGYLVGGPLVRFGSNRPLSLNLEFLNGASNHPSIGWISKARVALEGDVGHGWLLGAHVGAVFYDLHFQDGLIQRNGDFNRDLSLVMGLDSGWEF